jgi:hypothetical protein
MAKISVNINKAALTASMTDGRNRSTVSSLIRKEWENKIKEAQLQMIQLYETDPVTVEIDGGARASNSSGTLGGKGNLFSFIGFENGENPTQSIKQLLRNKINFSVKALSGGKFKIEIAAPTKETLYSISPIPWNPGRSWLDGIEKGISGLGSYIYRESPTSRSGTGIQTQKSLGGRFSNRSYMTTILKEFQRNVSK